MTLNNIIMNDNPVAYWSLDEASFVNRSGTPAATTSGTITWQSTGIVAGNRAARFTGVQRGNYVTTQFFYKDREHIGWSMEMWVRANSAAPTIERKLFGRAGNNGLFLVPSGYEFRMTTSLGTFIASAFVPKWSAAHHVAIQYADRVGTIILDGIPQNTFQLAGFFTSTDKTLFIGGDSTTSAAAVRISNVALYNYSISEERLAAHYLDGLNLPVPADVIESDGGISYAFVDRDSDLYLSIKEGNKSRYEGNNTIISIMSSQYQATYGFTTEGRQYDPIDLTGAGVIDGSRISWEGYGVTAEVSLDGGTTWAVCTNGSTIPGLGEGVNADGKMFTLRVNAGAGEIQERLVNLNVAIYVNKSMRASMTGMMATGIEPYTLAEEEKLIVSNLPRTGVSIRTPGSVTTPVAPSGTTWKTLEMWVRLPSAWGSPQYMFDIRNADGQQGWLYNTGTELNTPPGYFSSIYVNGVLKTPVIGDFVVGEWTHLVFVLATPTANAIKFARRWNNTEHMNIDIATVGLYPQELNSSLVTEHYTLGFSRPERVLTEGPHALTERPGSAYKYRWSHELGR